MSTSASIVHPPRTAESTAGHRGLVLLAAVPAVVALLAGAVATGGWSLAAVVASALLVAWLTVATNTGVGM